MTRPALFLDLDFQTALARAKSESKLLLVDATAAWCAPCKAMDKMTWSDDTVAARLAPIAISIQLDVDAHQATAKELRIMAMPTVVLFRDGVELARASGARGPEALLRWVDDAVAGRAAPDDVPVQAKAAQEIVARCKKFFALLEGNELDEAAEEGLWLWKNIAAVSPAMLGVKHSALVVSLKRLATAHPPSATALREMRDATPIDVAGADGLASIQDWVSLNAALGDEEKTFAWFDCVADALAENAPLAHLVRFQIVPVLVERGKWRDVGRAFPHPMAAIRKSIETRTRMYDAPVPPAHKERLRESATKGFREDCALIVRGLRAAARTAEAEEVVAAAVEVDPSPEMSAALSSDGT